MMFAQEVGKRLVRKILDGGEAIPGQKIERLVGFLVEPNEATPTWHFVIALEFFRSHALAWEPGAATSRPRIGDLARRRQGVHFALGEGSKLFVGRLLFLKGLLENGSAVVAT